MNLLARKLEKPTAKVIKQARATPGKQCKMKVGPMNSLLVVMPAQMHIPKLLHALIKLQLELKCKKNRLAGPLLLTPGMQGCDEHSHSPEA